MKNKKGFTLIELLAVIVILGILLSILIPRVSQYITNSRKSGLISTAQIFINSVRHDATVEDYPLPVNSNDVTIITLDKASLQKSKEKSSFGGNYIYANSYVVIINTGDGTDPDYKYFIAMQDSKNYAVPLTLESELDSSDVVANARNKMEVTIQPLCGTEEGTKTTLATISGLQDYQPTNDAGTRLPWNVTIFSTELCGKTNE